jgi:mono/diheme cytochrome c family protein
MRMTGSVLVAVMVGSAILWAQTALPQPGPGAAAVARGEQLFRTHCATCHGEHARGNGPLADQLRTRPPDLTTFTARNGGVFPSERVYRIIDGRGVASHGDREMPIWGNAFKASRDGLTGDAVRERIDALVRYLEAVQKRAAEE